MLELNNLYNLLNLADELEELAMSQNVIKFAFDDSQGIRCHAAINFVSYWNINISSDTSSIRWLLQTESYEEILPTLLELNFYQIQHYA